MNIENGLSDKETSGYLPEYRIGDYAKYLGVTPDFLKHYEQFRIVSSKPRENGYRYYPFSQSYKILESMRLRNYGIPLRDIDTALVDEDAEAVMRRLDSRIDDIERRIRFGQALIDEHRTMQTWFERMKDKKEDWSVHECEEMLFLPYTSQRSFLKDGRIYEILSSWLALMPMVKSCMRISRPEDLTCPLENYAWGLLIPASKAKTFELPLNDAVIHLPPRKTFFYHFSGKDQSELDPQLCGVYKKMSQLGLTPAGDIYMTMHMYTHINTDSLRYGYYAVPIE